MKTKYVLYVVCAVSYMMYTIGSCMENREAGRMLERIGIILLTFATQYIALMLF